MTMTASASSSSAAQRGDDAAEVVADLDLEQRVDAAERQLLADPRRVGVDDLAEQQLGADGQDVTSHGDRLRVTSGARGRGAAGSRRR